MVSALPAALAVWSFLFFFNGTATTEIYTLSLHDALPIFGRPHAQPARHVTDDARDALRAGDRKSTRLNSSHRTNSYAVFCLQKKNGKAPGEVQIVVLKATPAADNLEVET